MKNLSVFVVVVSSLLPVCFLQLLSFQKKSPYLPAPCKLSPDELESRTIRDITGSMTECARACAHDEGCEAFHVKSGDSSCTLLNDGTCSSNDFIPATHSFYRIQAPCKIPGQLIRASCVHDIGTNGGGYYFNQSDSYVSDCQITRIRVYHGVDAYANGLKGIKVTYGITEVQQGNMVNETGDCQLAPGEFVKRIDYSYVPFDKFVVGSLAFVTPLQTCGPYGVDQPTAFVEGNHLLYFAGMSAYLFDKLSFAFDSC